MTREEMINNVIRRFGFEAPETIRFCTYCEKFRSDEVIAVTYMWFMNRSAKEE